MRVNIYNFKKNSLRALQIYHIRVYDFLQRFEWYWKFTSSSKRFTHLSKRIHSFVDNVIKQKRDVYEKSKSHTDDNVVVDDDVGIKKRHAFLDLLLRAEVDGKPLSDDDIKEEVNTFMFAVRAPYASTFFVEL